MSLEGSIMTNPTAQVATPCVQCGTNLTSKNTIAHEDTCLKCQGELLSEFNYIDLDECCSECHALLSKEDVVHGVCRPCQERIIADVYKDEPINPEDDSHELTPTEYQSMGVTQPWEPQPEVPVVTDINNNKIPF